MTRKERQKKEKKAALRNAPEEDPEFQIAPMIDVLLVLLVFFMSISSTEVLQTVEGIDLPIAKDGQDPDKEAKGQAIINIRWNDNTGIGEIIVDEKTYPSAESLRPYLAQRVSGNPNVRVLIRGDHQSRYEFIRNVMKVVAEVGIGNVTFSVVDKETDEGAGPG